MKALWSTVAALVIVVAVAVAAGAEEKMQGRPGGTMVEAVSITATVEKIDYQTREFTLKGPKGGLITFIAGDEVQRFNEVKKGDQVTFDYAEGVAIDVQKATEAPKMVETQSVKREPGKKPSGTLETIGFLTAHVDEINYKTRVVKLSLPEGQSFKMTVGDQVNPFSLLPVTANASGAHLTQLGDNWEKFYYAKRSSATRRRDRAKRRHMSEHGEVRFVTAADADDARRTLETLLQQKHRAFARRGIPDSLARSGLREFFLDLASNPNIRGRFHISRVEIGDAWVAANFGIVFGDCYYHVLASYDDDTPASQYGPGALHLRELLAHAIKLDLRRFDFTIGDEPYKYEWSDTSVTLYDHCSAATWRGWPQRFMSTARRRLKRFIKQTPLIWNQVTRVRAAVGALLHPKATQRHGARTDAPSSRTADGAPT